VSITTEWRSDYPHRQSARAGLPRLASSVIFCWLSWLDFAKIPSQVE
jgi:hypothetical protein